MEKAPAAEGGKEEGEITEVDKVAIYFEDEEVDVLHK